MKHYRDSFFLILINIFAEYVLLLATYIVCGLVRQLLPESIAQPFHNGTIWNYFGFAAVVAFGIVTIYVLIGDYKSIHFRNKRRMIIQSFFVIFFGCALGAAFLFLIHGTTFSRWLLVMLIVAWTVAISIKRALASFLAVKLYRAKLESYRVLVLGNNDSARRYIRNLQGKQEYGYEYIGYLANTEVEYMEAYKGTYDKLRDVLAENKINSVIITEDNLSRKFLGNVLSVCAMLGADTKIIPSYSDFLSDGQKITLVDDLHEIRVNASRFSDILGVNISITNMESTIANIVDNLEKWRGKYVCVSNVHTTVMAHEDESYRDIQNGAVMALPDGGPLSAYSRGSGKSDARRVTGPDLMKELLKRSGEYGWRHFFYGSSEKTLEMLREKIEKEYPGAKIAGMISPPFRAITAEENEAYIKQINEANPDFVWVGLGAPKQEIWMAEHKDKINALMLGVGAAFDYESGNLKRAPKWMQKCNLEWLYRLIQEPKRLFKRYFITNLKFIWLTRR